MSKNPPRPTDAELEILAVLWSRGDATVREVHETIARRRPTQYTTVLKQMQVMTEKGLLRRNDEERAHIYEAARPRDWTQRQLASDILRRAFDGCTSTLMMGVLSSRRPSKKELAELRALLDEYESRS
jgi:BlaI family transcriptional regulator, penicillinase repressor